MQVKTESTGTWYRSWHSLPLTSCQP